MPAMPLTRIFGETKSIADHAKKSSDRLAMQNNGKTGADEHGSLGG
jgi:hypothetical protein